MKLFSGLRIKTFRELVKAGGILFLASGFSNFCNLLFNLFMVRRLSVVDYGVLNTLFSLFMILSMPAGTLQTVVTKFVAQFYGRKEFDQAKSFLLIFGKRVIAFGILFLLFFVAAIPRIAGFLKISSHSLFIITGFLLFLSIISPVLGGVLQGAQKFLAMAINGMFGATLKLILGIILVLAGFKVMGALLGVILAAFLAMILAFFQLPQELMLANKVHLSGLRVTSVYKYSVPVFFSLLSLMILTNSDMILVKHFFSPEQAGFYSVAQMVGKIILFLPAVIVVVLFPKMSEAFSQQRSVLPLLKKGLAITGILSVTAGIFCGLFPGLVLKALTGKEAVEAIRLVPFFCIAMPLYALTILFVFYNLAIHRFRFTFYLVFACLLQLSLISLLHPNLTFVIFSLIFTSLFLLLMGCIEAVKGQRL